MKKGKQHSCKDNMILNGESQFTGDSVIFWGECAICGKKLSEVFDYKDTRDSDNNLVK